MKKIWMISTIVLVVITGLGIAGFAYAQIQPTPPSIPSEPGMMQGGWLNRGFEQSQAKGRMGMMRNWSRNHWDGAQPGTYGPMHEYMINTMAEVLGISAADLQTRIEAGESMWSVAQSFGLTQEEFTEKMTAAYKTALEKAVSDGKITQEQAEWMGNMHARMQANGIGAGHCQGGGRMFGSGRWNNSSPDL